MSSGQQPGPHQPVSTTWTEPPWSGWIETTRDALLILEAARRGLIPRVTRRLVDSERKMITSGSVFVFDEDESGIKRWTDGFFWSPSRILGNFLLYRETDKRGAGHRNIRADQEVTEEGPSENLSLSRPKADAASSSLAVDKHRERSLVGSLTNSYKFKQEGLMKKTFSLTIGGVAQHLISYYKIEDVESGRLRSPSSLPELASLDISPEYLDKTHFRNPPKVEIGADGIPRYRGEADDTDISPTSASLSGPIPAPNIPPLLTEGRITEGSTKRGKRYDPYAQSSATKQRSRKNTRSSPHDGSNPSGEGTSSPVASGSNTPTMTAQSPPSATQPESDVAMTSVPPAIPHPPPYGMTAYFPGYLPPPGHMYAPPPPPQPGVSYPPPGTGANNGTTSNSSIATTTPNHVPQPGAVPPVHYAPYGYLPTVAHPSNSSASANLVTTPTQVRVSDLSQAGPVPITSQQPGPAPVAAAPVPGHTGQVPYSHGPPHYHYSYYPPHPAQFQPHGYPPAPGPVPYQWHYAAYSVPPQPPHPSAGQQQPQAVPVQAGVTPYTPQATQPQQRSSVAGTSAQAGEGEAEMDQSENN